MPDLSPEPPWLAYVGHWRTCAVTQSWECSFGGDPETDEAEAALCTCGFSAMLAAYFDQVPTLPNPVDRNDPAP